MPFIMYPSIRVTGRVSVWVYILNTHLSDTSKAPDQAGGAAGEFQVKGSPLIQRHPSRREDGRTKDK